MVGFHKSPSSELKQKQEKITPPKRTPSNGSSPSSSRKSASSSSSKPMFSRSFGIYFPRSPSSQVHAASSRSSPSDHVVVELRRQVEELREREICLQTELLELKLLKESVSVIPILESQIEAKNVEIEISRNTVVKLEEENAKLKSQIVEMSVGHEEQRNASERRERELKSEIRKLASSLRESEEHAISSSSSSQKVQGLMDVSAKSNLLNSLKRVESTKNVPDPNSNNNRFKTSLTGDEEIECGGLRRLSRNSEELTETVLSTVRSRVSRVPRPPPKRPNSTKNRTESESQRNILTSAPPPCKFLPPPPPPPPAKSLLIARAKVRKVPEVVEFYHSLMRRDLKRESTGGCSGGTAAEGLPVTSNARDMIGEIENRSAYLIAIKTDVETQGDFIRFLIKEVENAAFLDIEEVVPFVKWLDDELSYLVDERAVLKHFEWPEQRADALREAAFCYFDLKKLISEASHFRDDDLRQTTSSALKKMQALFEKLEHGVYSLSRMKESAATKFKSFQIPVDWMQETGIITQIKLTSVKLAMKYIKRVSAELEAFRGGGSSPEEEELIVQGVRFAFRVHQFAGGFDVDTMSAFQELREKATSCHFHSQSQNHNIISLPLDPRAA